MHRTYLCCLLLAVGCGPKNDIEEPSTTTATDPSGGEPATTTTTDPSAAESTSTTSDPGSGSGSDDSTTGSEPTEGESSTGSCDTDECLLDNFGFACVEFAIGEGVEGDPFLGTDTVVITMAYEPCLISYYEDKHPEMRADGPANAGGKVFAGWQTLLCAQEVEGRADCAVESFQQTLSSAGMNPIYNMSVTYKTPNPGQLAGGKLLWGPAPLEEFAECDAGDRPFVRLTGLADVVGLDAGGELLWDLQSFGVTPRALIDDDASGCLVVPITGDV